MAPRQALALPADARRYLAAGYRAMGQPRASRPPRSGVAAAQGSTSGAAIQQALVKVARVRHADSRAPARVPSLQLCR